MGGGARRAEGCLRVLGVDPGTIVTGWGVVEGGHGAVRHLAHGHVAPPARSALAERLALVHRTLIDCCAAWRPDVLALEQSFVGRNVQSAFRLGEVRGVAMLVAAAHHIAVAEYAPAAVKLAVTGTGRAEKQQVGRAIARELGLGDVAVPDEADALAIAICHLSSARLRALLATAPGRVPRGEAR